ncbi:MAG: hypothetical protein IGS48_09215 [Oscillatoriales cyanobacterium C42_A2020_001]|nr:hypothetical protein [Leptolyngbyaceae cyanobacterium C42_A2020_001]
MSQSSGYSATERVLCLSNGHGEDVIGVRILQALQQLPNAPKLAALPLVGEGWTYQKLGVPLIGPAKAMPSGGFIYMDGGRQFARDIRGGLLQLTLAQFRAVRQWAEQGGSILAVGDIVPLLIAYFSGAPYAFVGTAKSEYYLRDEDGKLFPRAIWEGWSGSVYYPWERWMMSRARCHAVFPRDTLTTKVLQKWSIPAFDLGNPMMDGLQPRLMRSPLSTAPVSMGTRNWNSTLENSTRSISSPAEVSDLAPGKQDWLKVLLLPGSRIPEAYENWKLILQAVDNLIEHFPNQSLGFVSAISPNLSLEPFIYALVEQGWQVHETLPQPKNQPFHHFSPVHTHWFTRQQVTLALTQEAYADSLHWADWAIAMAGTATEQFVGLGKPAITLPGKGPQFTQKFAEAQTRLLGESVVLVASPSQAAIAIHDLIQHPERLQRIAENGRWRMGEPGAAERIAQCLMQQLQQDAN